MDDVDKRFEELLKKARQNAGVETARRVQVQVNSYMRSTSKNSYRRPAITTSNTTS